MNCTLLIFRFNAGSEFVQGRCEFSLRVTYPGIMWLLDWHPTKRHSADLDFSAQVGCSSRSGQFCNTLSFG